MKNRWARVLLQNKIRNFDFTLTVEWLLDTECVLLFPAGEPVGERKASFELPETKTICVGLPASPSTRPCEEDTVCLQGGLIYDFLFFFKNALHKRKLIFFLC